MIRDQLGVSHLYYEESIIINKYNVHKHTNNFTQLGTLEV